MSLVNILNIQVLDNPTNFKNPFQFEITFECNAPLKDGNEKERTIHDESTPKVINLYICRSRVENDLCWST